MVLKTHLTFILNPMEASQHLPLIDMLLPKFPNWTSKSLNSVSDRSKEQTMFTELHHYPNTPNLDVVQLPHSIISMPCTHNTAINIIPLATVSSPTQVSAITNSEDEKSDLYNLKKISSSLSHTTRTRKCKERGCPSLAVSRWKCVRHGGGSRCLYEGCTNGAKLRNRCFQHGGYTLCQASGCNSKAKRYGFCWSHGGGRICGVDGCVKVSAQGGSCWAHGGGNRCKLESCSKRSYQMYGYYCKGHAFCNGSSYLRRSKYQ